MANLTFNSPFMLGFDELEEMLQRISKTSEGFPPYNVEQLENGSLKIVLAVAGYNEEDLHISLEDKQLIIRGKKEDKGEHRYLHKGIATRSFLKSFVLADGIEIQGAFLENGLLNIELKKPEKQVCVQKIKNKNARKKMSVATRPHKGGA